MSFIETPRFPVDISYGSSGGPEYQTTVVPTFSGHENRNGDWIHPRARYAVENEVKTPEQMYTLLKFFHAVAKGRRNGFRFKDWSDYSATVAEGILGAGIGTGGPAYQLVKRYASGAEVYDRNIKKPVVGTLSVYRAAVLQTAGVGAGNYSVDTTTGVITFVADDSEAVTGHTVGASHIFTTAADIPGLAIGEKVYLLGVTGTGAAPDALNGLAHTISNKTGTGPYTWTISTTTSGTASGGTAYAYPQAADALTAVFEFDVPVRFDTDHLNAGIDTWGTRSWTSVPILEIRQL